MSQLDNNNNIRTRRAISVVDEALILMGFSPDNIPPNQYKLLVEVISGDEQLLNHDVSDIAKGIRQHCLRHSFKFLPNFFLSTKIHVNLSVSPNELEGKVTQIMGNLLIDRPTGTITDLANIDKSSTHQKT